MQTLQEQYLQVPLSDYEQLTSIKIGQISWEIWVPIMRWLKVALELLDERRDQIFHHESSFMKLLHVGLAIGHAWFFINNDSILVSDDSSNDLIGEGIVIVVDADAFQESPTCGLWQACMEPTNKSKTLLRIIHHLVKLSCIRDLKFKKKTSRLGHNQGAIFPSSKMFIRSDDFPIISAFSSSRVTLRYLYFICKWPSSTVRIKVKVER